jgi:8-oxo-dGTP pyrophosphatase MutT (NUDIX family)
VPDANSPPDLPRLRAALALGAFDARAAQARMEPAFRGPPPEWAGQRAPREAAALAYVYEQAGALRLPLTLRHPDLREHRGQVSLPGGRPEDGESLWETAWREAREEIGLEVPSHEALGVLAPVYIPVTHTRLHVHVATGPAPSGLVAQPSEVERLAIVRLGQLLDPGSRRMRVLSIRGCEVDVPYFDVADLFVWGATAMALSELVERLRAVAS